MTENLERALFDLAGNFFEKYPLYFVGKENKSICISYEDPDSFAMSFDAKTKKLLVYNKEHLKIAQDLLSQVNNNFDNTWSINKKYPESIHHSSKAQNPMIYL